VPAKNPGETVATVPPQAAAVLRQLLGALMATAEDVGSRFAEEARRMHYEEAPARSIRGQTSPEEFVALQDEGIDVLRVPVVSKDDLN
jgi:hypothetical protein